MRFVIAAVLLVPAAALAGSAFDGKWKYRVESMRVTGKPDVFAIADGMYICGSCVPEVKVRADGTDQKVSGHDYYDTVAVRVLDARTTERTIKLKGRLIGTNTITVSADGATLTGKFTDYSGEKPASGSYTAKRVGAPPAPGAHATSGSWQQERMRSGNDALTLVNYEMTDEHFAMKANGQSYSAKFDGRDYPVTGDPAHTMVVLKRIDAHTVLETDKRDGRVTDEVRLAAAQDGRTVELTDKDLVHGQTITITLDKQ